MLGHKVAKQYNNINTKKLHTTTNYKPPKSSTNLHTVWGKLHVKLLTLKEAQPNKAKVKDADARLHSALEVLDKHLAKSTFFAGDNYTIAEYCVHSIHSLLGKSASVCWRLHQVPQRPEMVEGCHMHPLMAESICWVWILKKKSRMNPFLWWKLACLELLILVFCYSVVL